MHINLCHVNRVSSVACTEQKGRQKMDSLLCWLSLWLHELQEITSCIMNAPRCYKWNIIFVPFMDKSTTINSPLPDSVAGQGPALIFLGRGGWISLSPFSFLDRWLTSRLHNATSNLPQTHRRAHTPAVNTCTQLLLSRSYATPSVWNLLRLWKKNVMI